MYHLWRNRKIRTHARAMKPFDWSLKSFNWFSNFSAKWTRHYARPIGQRQAGLTKKKVMSSSKQNLVNWKKSFSSMQSPACAKIHWREEVGQLTEPTDFVKMERQISVCRVWPSYLWRWSKILISVGPNPNGPYHLTSDRNFRIFCFLESTHRALFELFIALLFFVHWL